MKKTLLSLICLFFCIAAFGQELIILKNPSFEDMPRMAKVPTDWYDCGFPSESPTDIQPGPNSSPFFMVVQQPSDGKSYIGMVARDNDTWEMVAQRLPNPLKAEQYYKFRIDLCRSAVYVSPSRTMIGETNYTSPVKLRLWGGNGYCAKKELLAETPLVINTEWESYELAFRPEENFKYILLECFYKTPALFPYNGNLLVDNASPIFPIEKTEADSLMTKTVKVVQGTSANYSKYSSVEDSIAVHERTKPRLTIKTKKSNAPPFDYEKKRNSTISNKPTKSATSKDVFSILDEPKPKPIPKKQESSSHDWTSNREMPDSVKAFLQNMKVDFDKGIFGGTTKINLIYILGNMVRTKDFHTITVGIAGNSKERDRLSQPFLNFMKEFGIPEERIQIKKIKADASLEDWIGKNEWYWVKVE